MIALENYRVQSVLSDTLNKLKCCSYICQISRKASIKQVAASYILHTFIYIACSLYIYIYVSIIAMHAYT